MVVSSLVGAEWRPYDPNVEPRGPSGPVLVGYLSGIVLGATSITLLFLGMRAVMDVGGACADGGPYVSAQPCPTGVPLAMIGGMFGLFGAAGLIVWFGSRIGKAAASIVALGWPALFIALGFNFLDYAFHPPDTASIPVWGWFIPGILFWLMGGAPVAVGVLAWRETRAGRPGNRLSQQVATSIPSRPVTFDVRPMRMSHARPPSPSPAPDLVDGLARLAELHEAGDLTDDEFATAKRDLLAGRETAT
jgi:putative oligomerization/nucleic acid binding protein